MIPKIGSKWKHYKTKCIYTVLAVGVHTEDNEMVVVYCDEDKSHIWIRPLNKRDNNDLRSCWNDSIINDYTATMRFTLVAE